MQQWPKHLTHWARKLPQVEEHEKPHSLHQDYQSVMQLQLCCFPVPEGSRPCLSVEHETICTISDCTTHVPFSHAQLLLLVNVHRETAKTTCATYNFLLSGMLLPRYNALFTFRVAKMLCFLLPNF